MKSLSAVIEEHKNQIETNAPFIFLLEVEVAGAPPTRLRLAQFDKLVNFGESDSGDDIPYYPAPMSVGTFSQDAGGSLPTLDVTVAMAGPLEFVDLDANDGYTDQPARVMVVSSLALGGSPIIDEEAIVVGASMGHDVIQFKISGSDLFQSRFPHIVYSRNSCSHTWGGHLCQYDSQATGAIFSNCGINLSGEEVYRPFSFEACEAAGADELNRGMVVRHPRLWGGKRGIPRG